MGLLLSPSPRKIELMMLYAVMNGMPRKQMVRYAAVPPTASSGVDMTAAMGRTSSRRRTVSVTETAIKSSTVFPMSCAACFRFSAPTACAMLTVVPIASPTIITVSICMTCEPMETAVVLATPSNCPMINRSAIP